MKIFCVGVGTKEGELVPETEARTGQAYLKDRQGRVVKSALNEEALQRIALATGGAYLRATGVEFGLDTLYDKKISKLEKRDIESKMQKQYVERFQIFLALAVLALFLEPLIRERR